MYLTVAISFSFLIIPSSFAQRNDNFFLYDNSEYGIKIIYPSNWELIENFEKFGASNEDLFNINIAAFQPPREGALDMITDSVIISIINLPDSMFDPTVLEFFTLLEMWTDFKIQFGETSIANFNLLGSTETMLANNPAHKIVYTHIDQRDIIKQMDIYTIIGSQVYEISYVAEESKFNSYLPLVEQMLDSISIS
jgi:serine/threonine-protein kinase